jgi:hypothetical protein
MKGFFDKEAVDVTYLLFHVMFLLTILMLSSINMWLASVNACYFMCIVIISRMFYALHT